ncbi:PspC domain-containing protein [Alistipes sp.]|uniref:PspC domain-containing protein n=1 Tax=Alistipes sp. TaxID=1872444 RepID=UPI003AF0EDAA
MNEIKKCSISGVAFTLDTDAYATLEAYLESLKKTYRETPGGAEIVADIEARIAELILTTQDNARVVEKPLIDHIIAQMGSVEDISESTDSDLRSASPRIPRRLYRDLENAKLGGVCAGIGRYFEVDPVWIRLAMFLPIVLTCLGWLPFLYWAPAMMGNLFGIFVICYLIMWFAVPAARTARQKLEMNGERITEQSIRDTTAAAAASPAAASAPDDRARPIVAEAVSAVGKVVLIVMKIVAGLLVFGLIMAACALIIGLFALIVGGEGFLPDIFGNTVSIWLASLGIVVALIPVILLIYVLMCLIASRKPGGKTVLAIFLVWLASIIACSVVAIRENTGDKFRSKRAVVEQLLESQVVIDGDTTTLNRVLEQHDDESIIQEGRKILHISVPSRNVEVIVNKERGEMQLVTPDKKLTVRADGERSEIAFGLRQADTVGR